MKQLKKKLKSYWGITPEQEAQEVRIAKIQRIRESK